MGFEPVSSNVYKTATSLAKLPSLANNFTFISLNKIGKLTLSVGSNSISPRQKKMKEMQNDNAKDH